MAVVLDCERIWLITCDHGGCHERRMLAAVAWFEAQQRARDEYGWAGDAMNDWCRVHAREHVGG